jgi:DNA-binding NarL/FixJ family response regulator
MTRPRLLLADDHSILIEGLRRLLEPEFEIAGTSEDGRGLVRAAARIKPDVIVADITMPLLNGIEAARQILKENKRARIVFLTMHSDAAYAMEALDTGALGYVVKSSAGEQLVIAIHAAMRGRVYVGADDYLSHGASPVRAACPARQAFQRNYAPAA